jgi:hypothetical protein
MWGCGAGGAGVGGWGEDDGAAADCARGVRQIAHATCGRSGIRGEAGCWWGALTGVGV